MEKNDIVEIEITGTTSEGDGVGRYDNLVIFVPYCIVGETIKAKLLKVNKNIAYGKLVEVVHRSENRISSNCNIFEKCGGCTYQYIKYETELQIKLKHLNDCLTKFSASSIKCNEIVPSSKIERYRNKGLYPVAKDGDKVNLGFYAKNSHRLVSCDDCLLHPEIFGVITAKFKEYIESNNVSVYDEKKHRGLLRNLYIRTASNGDIMVCVVINGVNLPFYDSLINSLKEVCQLKTFIININTNKTNVALGNNSRAIYGNEFLTTDFCGLKFRISANSFFQINYEQAENIINKVRNYIKKDSTVIDLYCGTGSIGLSVSDIAKKIIGVEILPAAIENAKQNAFINKIANTEFICADAKNAAEILHDKGVIADTVILDPPRKGCEPTLIELISDKIQPKDIIYISCNPATLARDINLFKQKGYNPTDCTAYDMFPRTPHVESVVLLTK